MSAAYFRRIYGNFNVVDNEALSASDFTPYSVLVPTTSTPGGTLPGAGTMIGGLFDPNSTAVNNVIKDAAAFGKQQSHWDGFDLECGRAAPERPVPSGRSQQWQGPV